MTALLIAAAFALVENGRPAAAFDLADTNATADVELFNSRLKEVTGAELPVGGAAANTIRVTLESPSDISRRFEWSIGFPSGSRMEIVATRRSLMSALVSLLEEGCDARFLGSERCMFQFEPRRDVAVEVRDRRSAPHGYTLHRDVYNLPGNRRELGLAEDGKFRYTHGIPVYAFPKAKYDKEGWPEAIMPTLKDGTKLKRPEGNVFVGWQPCYSNPETARIATENIFAYLRAHPEDTSITLGVNDVQGYCECERCREMNAKGEPSIFTNFRPSMSESYYRFVNDVAAAVEREFPAVRIGILAYTGTIMPPAFEVAKNVVPMMTFDLGAAAMDPEVVAQQEDVIRRWGQKVNETGTWAYEWGRAYLLPRVNAHALARRMKYLYANGGRAYFGEAMLDSLEGPKLYLISKLLADVDLDPDMLLDEWYARYAGKAAERPLRELFRRTEEYASSPRMKRTSFWRQRGYIYVQPTPVRQREQLAAITPGFVPGLLKLAREVHAAAGTPGEKRRAELLVRNYELLDVYAAVMGYAHCNPATMRPANPAAAAAMLRELADRAGELSEEFARAKAYFLDPDVEDPDYYRSKYIPLDMRSLLVEPLVLAGCHYSDPRVASAFGALAKCSSFPGDIRGVIGSIAAAFAEGRNLFGNEGFGNSLDEGRVMTSLPHELTDDVPCGGGRTLCLRPGETIGGRDANPYDNVQNDIAAFHLIQDIAPGYYYCASAKVWTDAQGPRNADFSLWRQSGGGMRDWDAYHPTPLKRGEWTEFSNFRAVDSSMDGVCFVFKFTGFKPGEKVYVGDVRLVRVAPLKDNRRGEVLAAGLMRVGGSVVEMEGRRRVLVRRDCADALTAFARTIVTARHGGLPLKAGEKLSVTVRCRSLDGKRPAVVGCNVCEKVDGAFKTVGSSLFWGRRLPTEAIELTGTLDASALAGDLSRHTLLVNLFMTKGSGPVAVESLSWEVIPVQIAENHAELKQGLLEERKVKR